MEDESGNFWGEWFESQFGDGEERGSIPGLQLSTFEVHDGICHWQLQTGETKDELESESRFGQNSLHRSISLQTALESS